MRSTRTAPCLLPTTRAAPPGMPPRCGAEQWVEVPPSDTATVAGCWCSYPTQKYESVGMMSTPNMWKNMEK